MNLTTIILAGGEGKRMRSRSPKALNKLCGRPLLDWALKAIPDTKEAPVAVLGFGADEIEAHYGDRLQYVREHAPRGSGGALYAAKNHLIGKTGRVLVLAGDLPLLKKQTLEALICQSAAAAFLTAELDNPEGRGRVLRAHGEVRAIIEANDVTKDTAHIRETRVSVYCFDAPLVLGALESLMLTCDKGIISMSDVIGWFVKSGVNVVSHPVQPDEALGVNDRVQLAACQGLLQRRINERHMLSGVTMIDPACCYIDDTVEIDMDCTIYPGVVLQGNTIIGEGTTLYPACRLVDSRIGRHCALQGVVANRADVGDNVTAGPYVNLRPDAKIAGNCKLGNYIEVKNSNVGEGSKLPHLSYIGDSDVGKRVNFGCGSVTVNYDGRQKHRTRVDDDAFIGCHTSLIAPVCVGRGAFTAAGSVITDDVQEDSLAIARGKQVNKPGYVGKLYKDSEE